MPTQAYKDLVDKVRDAAIPLTGAHEDFVPLDDVFRNARFVLIGEATHGTDEFYRMRAELTKHLMMHYGFCAVAVEADWPDAYRVNRYVRGDEGLHNADSALAEFTRFPTWMWRNEAVAEFIDWQKNFNGANMPTAKQTGFYGLDLYSLNASINAVVSYLEKVDPPAAMRARHHYSCFNSFFAQNPRNYGYAAALGIGRECEDDVVRQLIILRERAFDYLKKNGMDAVEKYFFAEQNAKVVVKSEEYYRSMFQGRVASWNLRDAHMADMLESLAAHLTDRRGEDAKIVVWAHNSHVGDARATEMGEQGELNIGQLAREHFGREAVLIGFSTYSGTVTAATDWDGEAEFKTLNPGMLDSYETLFHDTNVENFLLVLRDNPRELVGLHLNRLQRAVGVLYLPETEIQSHYFYSRLTEQFDAIIHLDSTRAVKPLEPTPLWHKGEMYEAYPTGF
ncbi:MAG: erythromycin esterase family protein [Alphaproteobacteria bacterium]|nr:erythromycin esterase family protein [Alphaproteobacteria bacterium]